MLIQVTAVELDFSDTDYIEKLQKITTESVVNSIYTVESEDDIADTISNHCGLCVLSLSYDILPDVSEAGGEFTPSSVPVQ